MPRAFQMLTSLAPSSSAHPQLDKRGATLDDKIKRLDAELAKGAEKARVVADATVRRLRDALGY